MAETIRNGRPRYAAITRAYAPYLLTDVVADDDYVIRLKYISKNPARSADGLTELSAIDSSDQIPNLPSQFHELVYLKTVEMIATDMAAIMNLDGTPRFPGAASVLQIFSGKYAAQLEKDMAEGRRRHIAQGQPGFAWAGSEIAARRR